MKPRVIKYLSTIVFLVSFLFAGCATKPVPYSFTADEHNFSSIAFKTGNPGVSFVSFDGQTLPRPENSTHWDPVNFPSDREIRIMVHADYRTNSKTTLGGFGLLGAAVNVAQDVRAVSRNVDADLEFICPPLETGRSYQLYFVKEPGMPGKNILTLTDIKTSEVIAQQEFEVVFGGDSVK